MFYNSFTFFREQNKKTRLFSLVFLVREAGVEPARPCEHRHLKPASLPIPPLAHLLNCCRSSATGHILTQRKMVVNNFFKIFLKEWKKLKAGKGGVQDISGP